MRFIVRPQLSRFFFAGGIWAGAHVLLPRTESPVSRTPIAARVQSPATTARGARIADQLLPIVKLFFPCEEAVYDDDAVAYRLLAPLHAIVMPPGVVTRFECERFDCYAQFSDAMGTFRLTVEVLPGDVDVVVYRSKPVELTFAPAARLAVFDVVFRMTGVRFRNPGLYRLRVVCNHTPLPDSEFWFRILPGVNP